MIEAVYNKKETEEQSNVRIPKNIRQIGNNKSSKKVYIEDYVMTQLKRKPDNEESIRYGVLLGEVQKGNGNMYIFVKAMVEVKDIIENSVIFNEDIWTEIYKDIKQYFDNMNIVGWFVSLPYSVTEEMKGLKKIHMDNFAGNDKVCFLRDRIEKEEGFYVYEQGGLKKQQGYYIYYEKNERMKKYIKGFNNKANNEIVKMESNEEYKKKEAKSLRDMLQRNEAVEPKRQGRLAYGVSGLLTIALLLSTVVMLSNYGELKNIKETLAAFNINQQAQAVNQMLVETQESSSEIISTNKETSTENSSTTQQTTPEETLAVSRPLSEHSGKTHVVEAGQTLYDISLEYYDTSDMVNVIKEYNNIDDDYKIIEGQKILLP